MGLVEVKEGGVFFYVIVWIDEDSVYDIGFGCVDVGVYFYCFDGGDLCVFIDGLIYFDVD